MNKIYYIRTMKEESIVRENLMNDKHYRSYCGSTQCNQSSFSRVKWDKRKKQFTCKCGWVSNFPKEFIDRYIEKWNL